MLCHILKEWGVKNCAVVPVVSITFPYLVLVMVAGLGCLDAGLCILAKKLKKPGVIAIFVLSFVCCLGMGYLST